MSPNKKINILLVDDDVVDQKIFNRALCNSDLEYDLKILDEFTPNLDQEVIEDLRLFDIIFLDYNFPVGVSSNLVHLLKKHWNFEVPIVLLTGTESDVLKKNIEAYDDVFYRLKEEKTYQNLQNLITEILKKKD